MAAIKVNDLVAPRQTTMLSLKQHMRCKEMWTGPQKRVDKSFYTVALHQDGKVKFVKSTLNYTPALYKTIDEIMVNAVDHKTNFPNQVTYIKISYDINSGIVQVINNGPGIPVYRVEIKRDRTGEPTLRHLSENDIPSNDPNTTLKWFPQWISEEPLTGNNLEKRKIHITGGVNGAGMKLANYLSESFMIETIDGTRNKKYRQIMEKGSSIIHEPTVISVPQGTESYTSIMFKPDYKYLDYPNPSINDYMVIEKLIRTRAYQIASYCGVDVYYNGQLLTIKSIADLGEMFAPELKMVNIEKIVTIEEDEEKESDQSIETQIIVPDFKHVELQLDSVLTKNKKNKDVVEKRTYAYSCQLKSEAQVNDKGEPLIWNVCVGPSMSEKFEHMSVVNGMYIIDGGCHINWITKQVTDFFEKELARTTQFLEAERNRIQNNLYVVMVGPINLANISVEGQTKEKISIPRKEYSGYLFTTKQLKEIWNICEPFVISSILEKGSGRRKNKKPVLDKYKPAKFSKDKKRAFQCSLFVPEGDSASNLIDGALTDKSLPKFTYDYYGYYNIQGVPMNARRFSKLHTNPKTGEKKMLYSNSIRDNERLEGLYHILGLDEEKTYDFTSAGEKDFSALNYGSVILATDQDEDGKGQITSLLINYFMVFWPALIKRGYIRRLNTPIIRALRKSDNVVKSFNSITGYKSWRLSLNVSDEQYETQYKTDYYKGLAKHDEDDIRDIFNNFDRNLVIFTLDERSQQLFEEYFGKDAEYRKSHLRSPVTMDFAENARVISVSDHLAIDTKSFKRYVIMRMLPHAYDGLLLGRRKVFATARLVMNKNQEMNVSSLAGRVKAEMNYHHGDSAISDTITKMGQEFFPRLIPLFLGNSIAKGFGSRKFGGHNMAEARYISIKQNAKVTDLMFPEEDDYILPYEFEEGKRCEPKYYLPIIPMALLETQHHPSQGWDIKTWARDWKSVFRNVKRAIISYNLENIVYTPYTIGLNETQQYYSFTSGKLLYTISQLVNNPNDPSQITKYNADTLIASLEVMEMDKTGWFGKIVKYQKAVTTEDNTVKTKLYSVGAYRIDNSSNQIVITELPHGLSSDNFSFGNRKAIQKAKEEFEKEEKKAKEDARKRWEADRAQLILDDINDSKETKRRGRAKKSDNNSITTPDSTQLTFESLMKMSAMPDISKQILSEIKTKNKNINIFDKSHGNEHDTILQLDSIDEDKFYYADKKFITKSLVDKEFVKSVDDRSTDKNIEIYVELEDGALDKIKLQKSEIFDGVIEHFKLRVAIHDNLNMIDGDSGYIREFKSYDEIFRSWFDARRKLYEERFRRTLIIKELQIYKLELIQKFCTQSNTGLINISRKSRAVQEQILDDNKYPRIATSIINDPKYIPVSQIKYEALDNKINLDYKYIIQLTQGQLSEDNYAERAAEIDKLKTEIAQMTQTQKYFPGALAWLDELQKLEIVVERGLREGWGYDQRKKKYNV